jgi:electron transfer flavoprotein alpha/beta subunit
MKAMKAQIARATAADLGLATAQAGRPGSKVKVVQYSLPKKKPAVQIIPGTPREAAIEAVRILMDVERVL